MMRYIAAAFLLAATTIQAKDRVPVVVELFTSEGCSSCPPADDLLAKLESQQPVANAEVIVLSEHVDYWNSLGWKDPFSAATFSERQQAYAGMLRSSDVYTPQALIDGHYVAVGSNRTQVLQAITAASEAPKADLEISATRQGDMLEVQVPSVRGKIWIAVTQARAVSRVAHGENGGHTLQHVGVVRSLNEVTSHQVSIKIDQSWGSDLRVVAFVQDAHTGKILQAVQKSI